MPTTLKSQVIFVKTKKKHAANIPGTAERTSKIKALVKKIKNIKGKITAKCRRGFYFQDKSKLKGAEEEG